jgi:sugar O-acyltransferase (sialic acid O-acetyltransferase NeuD family)
MAIPQITLYGASGHSNALRHSLEQHDVARVVAFIDDFRGDQGHVIDGRPVVSFETWRRDFRERPCLVAVANTAIKRMLVGRVSAAGGTFCTLYDAPGSTPAKATIGVGSFVVPPVYVGPNTTAGDHVVIMPMTSIGHDVRIGDYCTICPSSTIGGHVDIESAAFIGAGSTIINGKAGKPLVIGASATIAVGAVVTKSVLPGATVMGNPARPLRELAANLRSGRCEK